MQKKIKDKEIVEILASQFDSFFDVMKNTKKNHLKKINKNLFLRVRDVFFLFNTAKKPEEFSKIFGIEIVGDDSVGKLEQFRDAFFGEYSSEQLTDAAIMFYNSIMFGCRAEIEHSQNRKWCWVTESHMFYGIAMRELMQHFQTTDLINKFASLLLHNTQAVLSTRGKLAAQARLENDPKQREKGFVYECWQGWQKKPDTYKSKAAFARDMLTKCEHLTSSAKIEDWCREWGKSVPS